MLKIMIAFLLAISINLHSQQYKSAKSSIFNHNSSIELFDANGDLIISMDSKYRRYKSSPGKIKFFSVNGETYSITKVKGFEKVFSSKGKQVASMEKNGKNILFLEEFELYKMEKPKMFLFDDKTTYKNRFDENVLTVECSKRRYQVQFHKTEFTQNNDLLMALSLHQFLETQIRKANDPNIFATLNYSN